MIGLILTGGSSSRMGNDKACIDYHGMPQYLWVKQLLKPFCDEVFICCKEAQAALFKDEKIIFDAEKFADLGPASALLTAFGMFTGPFLMVGCDYPFLMEEDIEYLIKSRNKLSVATVFRNTHSGFVEPLIGIYEPECKEPIMKWFESGGRGIRMFLEDTQAYRIPPARMESLFSADTPEEKRFAIAELKK